MRYVRSQVNLYVLKCFFLWSALTAGVLLFVVTLFEMIEIIRRAQSTPGIHFGFMFEMAFLKVPSHLSDLCPFICFFSMVMCFWRLNQTGELVALRAMGISIWQWIQTTLVSSLIISIFFLFILDPVRAALIQRLAHIEGSVFKSNALLKISVSDTGIWFREPIDNQVHIFYASSYDMSSRRFHHVVFHHYDVNGTYKGKTEAEEAALDEDGFWILQKGRLFDEKHSLHAFDMHRIPTKLSIKNLKESQINPDFLSIFQLFERQKTFQQFGLSTHSFKIRIHGIFAQTGLIFALSILALNFCLRPQRHYPAAHAFITGIILCFALYFLNDVTTALGSAERIPPLLAVWVVPVVTIFLSLTQLMHTEDNI